MGDIGIGYKMLGNGDPILLFNGASDNMDAWDPSFLRIFSSNHTVIVFDTRGLETQQLVPKHILWSNLRMIRLVYLML